MDLWLIDSMPLERQILSNFLVALGHSVSIFEKADLPSVTPGGAIPIPQVLITAVNNRQVHGAREIESLHLAWPGVPIIVVAEHGFMVPLENKAAGQIQAFIRRPMHLEEMDLMLRRVAGA